MAVAPAGTYATRRRCRRRRGTERAQSSIGSKCLNFLIRSLSYVRIIYCNDSLFNRLLKKQGLEA